MMGHIDRRVVGGKERRALEVKTTSIADDWGEDGTTEIPNYVMCQIQHYMHVIKLDVVDVAVLIGGNDYRQYEIPRMDDLIRRIIEAEEEFWDRVEAKVPPEPEFEHRSMTELIKNLYPGTNGSIIELPEVAQKYHDVLKDAAEQRQIYEKIEIGCKNRLAMLLGEGSIGMLPDGTCYTRKEVKRKEYVSPESSYMRMAHSKKLPKEAAAWIEDHRKESTALETDNDGI
jgi:predicted phage-related endonuclease